MMISLKLWVCLSLMKCVFAVTPSKWKDVKLPNILSPKVRWEVSKKNLYVCLPERSKWVQVRFPVRSKEDRKEMERGLEFIFKEIRSKVKSDTIKDVFMYSRIEEVGAKKRYITNFFSIPDDSNIKYNLCWKPNFCGYIQTAAPTCYVGSRNKKSKSKFIIPLPASLKSLLGYHDFEEVPEGCKCY